MISDVLKLQNTIGIFIKLVNCLGNTFTKFFNFTKVESAIAVQIKDFEFFLKRAVALYFVCERHYMPRLWAKREDQKILKTNGRLGSIAIRDICRPFHTLRG